MNETEIRELLTPNQYKVLTLIAAGYSNREVSAKISVPLKSIEFWRKNHPEFKRLLRQAQAQCFDAAIAEIISKSQEVASELTRIALDPDTPTRTRLTAIIAVLDFAKAGKQFILEERLELLEKQINGDDYDTVQTTARSLANKYAEDETN